MPAARKPAAKADSSAAYAVVKLSYEGRALPVGSRVDEILPPEVLAACIERGEASRSKP